MDSGRRCIVALAKEVGKNGQSAVLAMVCRIGVPGPRHWVQRGKESSPENAQREHRCAHLHPRHVGLRRGALAGEASHAAVQQSRLVRVKESCADAMGPGRTESWHGELRGQLNNRGRQHEGAGAGLFTLPRLVKPPHCFVVGENLDLLGEVVSEPLKRRKPEQRPRDKPHREHPGWITPPHM